MGKQVNMLLLGVCLLVVGCVASPPVLSTQVPDQQTEKHATVAPVPQPAATPIPAKEQKTSKPFERQAVVLERERTLPVDQSIRVWSLIGASHLPWVALETGDGVMLIAHRDGSLAGLLTEETKSIALGNTTPYLAVLTDEALKVITLDTQSALPLLDAEVSLELPVASPLTHLLGFSPRDTYLLLQEDRTVRGYALREGTLAFEVTLPEEATIPIPWVMTDDEQLLLCAPPQGNLLVIDAAQSRISGEIEFNPISALALSPDGKRLAVAENRAAQHATYGTVFVPLRLSVWEMSISREQDVQLSLAAEFPFDAEFDGVDLPVILSWLQFYPGEQPLLLGVAHWPGEGDTPSRILLWDTSSGQQLARHQTQSRILGHALVNPQGTLATYDSSEGVVFWSAKRDQ